MLLFGLWTLLMLGALTTAGYSHYRYRVKKNEYYSHLFAKDRCEPVDPEIERNAHRFYPLPVVTLGVVAILVPMSLLI